MGAAAATPKPITAITIHLTTVTVERTRTRNRMKIDRTVMMTPGGTPLITITMEATQEGERGVAEEVEEEILSEKQITRKGVIIGREEVQGEEGGGKIVRIRMGIGEMRVERERVGEILDLTATGDTITERGRTLAPQGGAMGRDLRHHTQDCHPHITHLTI